MRAASANGLTVEEIRRCSSRARSTAASRTRTPPSAQRLDGVAPETAPPGARWTLLAVDCWRRGGDGVPVGGRRCGRSAGRWAAVGWWGQASWTVSPMVREPRLRAARGGGASLFDFFHLVRGPACGMRDDGAFDHQALLQALRRRHVGSRQDEADHDLDGPHRARSGQAAMKYGPYGSLVICRVTPAGRHRRGGRVMDEVVDGESVLDCVFDRQGPQRRPLLPRVWSMSAGGVGRVAQDPRSLGSDRFGGDQFRADVGMPSWPGRWS